MVNATAKYTKKLERRWGVIMIGHNNQATMPYIPQTVAAGMIDG
jgi:hypothetical protein